MKANHLGHRMIPELPNFQNYINRLGPIFWLLAGIFASIFVTFVSKIVYDKYKQPRLQFTEHNSIDDKYLIDICNRGRVAAENCEVDIIILNPDELPILPHSPEDFNRPRIQPGIIEPIRFTSIWRTSPLSDTSDINVGQTKSVYLSSYDEDYLIFPSRVGFDNPSITLSSESDRYESDIRLKIKCTASNTNSIEKEVSISILRSGLSISKCHSKSSSSLLRLVSRLSRAVSLRS